MRRGTILVALAGLVLLVVASVALVPRLRPQSAAGLRVVTTTTVLADLVQQVGQGRLTDVRSVVPAGVDVEDYNPTPSDLQAVAAARLFVMNGLALDLWAPKLVQSAQPGLPTLVLSDGLPAQGDNPHFWLDPNFTRVYVQKIDDALKGADPDGASTYDANTAAYEAQLDDLDAWIHTQVATLPSARRKLVTFHEAYPYFAQRYGFELVGVVTPSPGQEPSAADLATLVSRVREAHVPAVFSEAQFSPRLMQTLASEAGISRVVTDLYNDSLGDAPADSYVGMMRYNVQRIVEALS